MKETVENILLYEEYKGKINRMALRVNSAVKGKSEYPETNERSDADIVHTVIVSSEFEHAVEHVVSEGLAKSNLETRIERLESNISRKFEEYERKTFGEFEKLNKRFDEFESSIDSKVTAAVENAWSKKIKAVKITTVITTVVAAITCILALFSYFGKISDIEVSLATLTNDVEYMREDLTKMETEIEGIDTDVNGLSKRLSNVETKVGSVSIAANNSEVGLVSIVDNNISTVGSSCTSEAYVGRDRNGKHYTAGDIAGKPVLLTYTENDLEVYFYGQLNDNYHWDGFCITNAYYPDGTLFSICEYNFDDGVREDFKSLYETSDRTKWIYADKVCDDGKNFGPSITYEFANDIEKDFTSDTVEMCDIIRIREVLARNDKILLSYYYNKY